MKEFKPTFYLDREGINTHINLKKDFRYPISFYRAMGVISSVKEKKIKRILFLSNNQFNYLKTMKKRWSQLCQRLYDVRQLYFRHLEELNWEKVRQAQRLDKQIAKDIEELLLYNKSLLKY